jgi:hypothetical protein
MCEREPSSARFEACSGESRCLSEGIEQERERERERERRLRSKREIMSDSVISAKREGNECDEYLHRIVE